MTAAPLPDNGEEKQWHVCCDRFVSVGFAEIDEAQAHLQATKHHGCAKKHTVTFIDLDYGTRVEGKS